MSLLTRTIKKANKIVYPKHLLFGPEYIVLGVNNVCNLHCKMCDVGTQNLETNFAQNLVGSHPLNMPIELFKKVVDEVAENYPKAKLGFAFTEPLVYPHLKEALLYAKQKNIYTSLTTNALNLKRKADDLVEGGLKKLMISLDGLGDVHNEIRGNAQSFQKAIEGIEYITSKSNEIEVSVFCVITEWNYTHLLEFVKYMSAYKLQEIGFMHQNFITKEVADNHNLLYGNLYHTTHSNIEQTNIKSINLSVLHSQIKAIKDQANQFAPKVSFSPEINELSVLETYYHHPEIKVGRECNDVFRNVMIKTDGHVIPAHGRCFNVSMGNLNHQSLPEVWNSTMYGKFRSDLMQADGLFPACNRCCSAR